MDLLTEAYQRDLNQCFDEFNVALGGSPWRKVVASVSNEIKGNPFLGDYLRSKFSIAFALQRLSEASRRGGLAGLRIDESVPLYEASVLVMQFCHLRRVMERRQAVGLAQRIKGALKNAADMRAMIFELQLLTHFAHRGYEIVVPPAAAAVSPDGFVSKDGTTYEIECKSVSGDKGRQVHRRDALEIHHLFQKRVAPILGTLRGGLLIRVTFDGRPPKAHNDRLRLIAFLKEIILSGKERVRALDAEVSVITFSVRGSPFELNSAPTNEVVAEFLEKFGVVNREAISWCVPGQKALVVSLESRVPDRLLEETFSVASDAAKRQLSGARAGLLCIKFEDLSAEQMTKVGAEDGEPTALRRHASRFLDSSSAANASLVGFFADGPLLRQPDGAVTRKGVSYYFLNEKNKFSVDLPAVGLFREPA